MIGGLIRWSKSPISRGVLLVGGLLAVIIRWLEGFTVEVTSERLLAELDASNGFVRADEIGKETGGGGLKTHVRPPKSRGRPPKSRKHLDKSKQATKEEVKAKKPKGLRKPKKRAD